jgi:DNA-binding transcriptional ArsR family regulator
MTPTHDDSKLLSALRHPLRRRILREMADGKEASPNRLAGRLGEPLTNVSYHVRVLAACGAVALVRTEPARGSVQHFYRRTVDAPWVHQLLELEESASDPGESPG